MIQRPTNRIPITITVISSTGLSPSQEKGTGYQIYTMFGKSCIIAEEQKLQLGLLRESKSPTTRDSRNAKMGNDFGSL